MPRKLIIIGLDSFSYKWLDPLFSRGYLSNLKETMETGSSIILRAPILGATPHHWATISTGTEFTYHGCIWWVDDPEFGEKLYGFSANTLLAEPIWGSASKAGLRCILLDVPQSFPVLYTDIIHVGEDGRPDSSFRCLQQSKGYVSSKIYDTYMTAAKSTIAFESYKHMANEHLEKIYIKKCEGWNIHNINNLYETEINIKYKNGTSLEKFYLLINPAEQKVELYSEKCNSKKLGESIIGSWSKWIIYTFKIKGQSCEACFRFKLLKLDENCEYVHVYFSQIYPVKNFAYPEEICEELVKKCGPYLHTPTRQQVVLCGACDIYTFIEELEYQNNWYANAVKYLLESKRWDLVYMKIHSTDFLNHLCAYMIDENYPLFNFQRFEEGWKLWGKVVEPINMIIKVALSVLDNEGVLAIVSDHGSKLTHPHYIYSSIVANKVITNALKDEGLIDYVRPTSLGFRIISEEGQPRGISYEKIRMKTIEVLRDLKDPVTGTHLFKLVCKGEEAVILGYGGRRAPDIFVWPNYGDQKEIIPGKVTADDFKEIGIEKENLGSWEWPFLIPSGVHDTDAMFIIKGPGVKKGYRATKIYPLTSVTPTLCYLTGIPTPKDSTGGIIWEITEC